MNDIIGIAWYKDKSSYRKALSVFTDTINLPPTYEDWQNVVRKELEQIKNAGNIALRVDIEPETFADWCRSKSYLPDSHGRIAFVNSVELEYEKTGKGTIIEFPGFSENHSD
jgi:hypothetical protein